MSISGKPKEHCIAALRAANGNPDRACEFLFSGAAFDEGEGMEDYGGEYGDEGDDGGNNAGNPFMALA